MTRITFESTRFKSDNQGFTLLESLVVIVMIGIVAAVAVPGCFGYLERRRLDTIQSKVHQALQLTQVKAQSTSSSYRFSIRENVGTLEWSIHPTSDSPTNWETLTLSDDIQIDAETSLSASPAGTYYVKFDYKGNLDSTKGTLTFSLDNHHNSASKAKRCIVTSTLLGAMRQSKEQPTPRSRSSGQYYCY